MSEYQPPRPTYSKWFWKDLLAKTQWMSASGLGAYIRVLGYMVTVSDDYCSAPDDDLVLSRIAGMGLKGWRRVRPEVVHQLESTDSGRLRSRRLSEDADVWAYHCEAQHLRRTAGGPPVDRRPTGCPPDDDHTRSREMPDTRKNLEAESLAVTNSDSGNVNPAPVGAQWPVAIATGTPNRSPR